MRILVYEYATAGGAWAADSLESRAGGLVCESLLCEGAAMIGALSADLLRIPGVEVLALWDRRLKTLRGGLLGCQVTEVSNALEARTALAELAAGADWTVVVAPEFDGILLDRCRHVEASGGKLLSPGPELVKLASDKHHTAQRLAVAGVPVPRAVLLEGGQPPPDFPYPAVLKPRDGAGSVDLRRIDGPADLFPLNQPQAATRLESYCEGIPASVAVLCGPETKVALPACRQQLSDDGRFRYLGGETPLAKPLCRRARRLALAALEALPPAIGYVGVDLVLGGEPDGGSDVVIEINPRLTTSYVGLRALAQVNLSLAMLQIAQARRFELSFGRRRVEFEAAPSWQTVA